MYKIGSILTMLAVLVVLTAIGPVSAEYNISDMNKSGELKKFSSIQEIRDFINPSLYAGYPGYAGPYAYTGIPVPAATPAISIKGYSEAIADYGPTAYSEGVPYSQTNIQVEGVDEADFVKNDDKYIYMISQNRLFIIDAYPANVASIISETVIPGNPRDMFVNGDRLAIFTEDYYNVPYLPVYDIIPQPRYVPNTNIIIYNISDRTKPEHVMHYTINGNYFQSRMIDDYIYFITKEDIYYPIIDIPTIKDSVQKTVLEPDVYYFDEFYYDYVFNTVASINIKSGTVNAKTFLLGYSDNLYVSQDNIYITYQMRNIYPPITVRFYDVMVPNLPEGTQQKILDIRDNSNITEDKKWDSISLEIENLYGNGNMSEQDKKSLSDNTSAALKEYDARIIREREKTVIHKINISNGDIVYKNRGMVPGTLLNQFSMDEYNGYFRVATTQSIWDIYQNKMFNNVYVLDDGLNITGRLEGIAPEEKIYSTRFMGDKLYMVTFKRMDPLFVIGLSDPNKPEILGQLKIPGYSDYLHPYDENHIIGVGKETEENQWGGVQTKGVKISLFNVSNVSDPIQVGKYEIGGYGTDSEALRDHKAFLFDKNRNLLVIPISDNIWQGAYVLNIDKDKGIQLKGSIAHYDSPYYYDYYGYYPYYPFSYAVRRSLYIGDTLYTISDRKVMMNNITDLNLIRYIDLILPTPKFTPTPFMDGNVAVGTYIETP